MTYFVSKTFSFCYGHRLPGDNGRCSHLHGHSAKATVTLACDRLDEHGMVYHFDKLKETIGKWIAETLDHKLLLSQHDPVTETLRRAGEEFFAMPASPTAENIARLIFIEAARLDLSVVKVDVRESDTAMATFSK